MKKIKFIAGCAFSFALVAGSFLAQSPAQADDDGGVKECIQACKRSANPRKCMQSCMP